MKISIISATLNSATYIRDCLASINSQSYDNLEHIIIDGASTDSTLERIKLTRTRVTKILSEPDKGIYDAINKGLKMVTGDIVGFLHADDTFASTTILENIAETFINKTIDGIYGNLVYINTLNKVVRTWRSKPFHPKNVLHGWMPPHPTLFLRKEIYEKHGLFDTSFKIAGDYDFILRLMVDEEITLKYIPETITIMRMGGASNRNLMMIARKSYEDYIALKKNNVGGLNTLIMKNLQKIPQLFSKNVN